VWNGAGTLVRYADCTKRHYKGWLRSLMPGIQPIRPDLGAMTFEIFQVQPTNAAKQPSRSDTYRSVAPCSAFALKSTPSKALEGMARLYLCRFEGACGCQRFLVLTTAIRERNTVP